MAEPPIESKSVTSINIEPHIGTKDRMGLPIRPVRQIKITVHGYEGSASCIASIRQCRSLSELLSQLAETAQASGDVKPHELTEN